MKYRIKDLVFNNLLLRRLMNDRNALDRRIYALKKQRDAIIASWEPKKK